MGCSDHPASRSASQLYAHRHQRVSPSGQHIRCGLCPVATVAAVAAIAAAFTTGTTVAAAAAAVPAATTAFVADATTAGGATTAVATDPAPTTASGYLCAAYQLAGCVFRLPGAPRHPPKRARPPDRAPNRPGRRRRLRCRCAVRLVAAGSSPAERWRNQRQRGLCSRSAAHVYSPQHSARKFRGTPPI